MASFISSQPSSIEIRSGTSNCEPPKRAALPLGIRVAQNIYGDRLFGISDPSTESTKNDQSSLVFVFNGQGSQWNKMGLDLMETSSTFRSTIERLQTKTSLPLVNLYKDGSRWLSKEYSSIGIVSFQLGLLAILRKHEIRAPDFYLGHSVGELMCPFVAGFFTEEEVLQCAAIRTNLIASIDAGTRLDIFEHVPEDGFDYVINLSTQENLQLGTSGLNKLFVKRRQTDSPKDPSVVKSFSMDGRMVVMGCSAATIENVIGELRLRETRVACYNCAQGQTISGPAHEIDLLVNHFQNHMKRVFVREVDTDSVAYHAIYLEVFREFLRAEFDKFKGTGSLPSVELPPGWISTSRKYSFDMDYLIENMLSPVYFQEAIELLPERAKVVEIGPSSILLSQLKRIRTDLQLMSLIEKNDPIESLNASLMHLQEECPTCVVRRNVKQQQHQRY